jgi:nitrite reductase/ring-hydroxylating ferredoxin subunit/uncharacterized membrane protein
MNLRDLKRGVESAAVLDRPGQALQSAVANAIQPTEVKNALNGSWLGHPLHPLMTDFPIGAWSMSVLLDWVGGPKGAKAADKLLVIGILSAVPTAATGAASWSEFNDAKPRRVGLVHAAANSTALGFFTWSYLARKRGKRWKGRALSLAGTGAMTVGGWLGGHLSYDMGIGVNRTAFEPHEEPQDWQDAVALDALTDGKPHCVNVGGSDVVLVREGTGVYALANTCGHMGGPLAEGEVTGAGGDACITCPWHGSTFRLADATVVRSPAVSPQPRYETRVLGGIVQLKSEVSHR